MRDRYLATRRVAAMVLCIGVGLAALPAATGAQAEATTAPGSFCTLLTNDEASAAFGIDLVLTGVSGLSCTWSPSGKTPQDASLVPALFPGTLQEIKDYYANFPGGTQDITVGGQPGLLRVQATPWQSGLIVAEVLGQSLQFQWDDFAGVDPAADVTDALTQVIEAALPRVAAMASLAPPQAPTSSAGAAPPTSPSAAP